jgi:hypothetical protein
MNDLGPGTTTALGVVHNIGNEQVVCRILPDPERDHDFVLKFVRRDQDIAFVSYDSALPYTHRVCPT